MIVVKRIKDLSHVVLWGDSLFDKQPQMCEVASEDVRKCIEGSTVQVQTDKIFVRNKCWIAN